MSRRAIRHCVLLLVVACVGSRSVLAEEFLYLENTDSGDVSVISIPEHEVVSTIAVGKYLDDVAASSDGRTIYVNRVESAGHPLSKRLGESGEVIAISTESEEIVWRAPTRGWPHHMTLSADDELLFVPLYDRPYLEVFNTKSHEAVGLVPAPFGSHGTRLSADGRRLYVGSMLMDMLLVYDLAERRPVKRIALDDAVRPFAFTADEKTAYVQLSRLHGFEVVDLETGQVTQTVHLPTLDPDTPLPEFYPHTVNHGLEISPDETLLLAAGSASGYVCAYSLPDLELRATIPVGEEPNWIVFTADGRYAYVSNRASDTVSVIDVARLEETKQIPVGDYPQRMRIVDVPHRAP